MAFRLEDRYVWDFWVADDGETYHLFYLQAPRALPDPDLRHFHATVGHATSHDLTTWEVVGDALTTGPRGAWDDVATWTGSVIQHGERWYLFYTGASSADGGLVQRIGLATSDDLTTWIKHPDNPLVIADPRWYEQLDLDAWHDQAWRDPWVLADPSGDGFHMVVTARTHQGKATTRGVIGHAWSPDLVTWEVRPPVSTGGRFGHLEVPQILEVDGTHNLLFSCAASHALPDPGWPEPAPGWSYLSPGAGPLGPFDIDGAVPLAAPGLYSCRVVTDRDGRQQVIGFVIEDEHGDFAGELSDPLPLESLLPSRTDGRS